MSRWVEFDVIEIQSTGPNSANIMKLQNVPINADAVVMVIPTLIPSELSAPNGSPVQRPGAGLSFMGAGLQGPSVMVAASKEEVLWKLQNGPFLEIKKPDSEGSFITERKSYPDADSSHLKLIHPAESNE